MLITPTADTVFKLRQYITKRESLPDYMFLSEERHCGEVQPILVVIDHSTRHPVYKIRLTPELARQIQMEVRYYVPVSIDSVLGVLGRERKMQALLDAL